MKDHGLWMIIGCTLPLLLIFVLPILGISGNFGIFIFIIVMFGCHLLAMRSHRGEHTERDDSRGGHHGTH